MNDINLQKISLLHWYPDLEKHKCGYCKKENGAVSYGMWAEQLAVEDYQDLIDRGWRRSGMYCYKAIMDETCCPLYTVRCKAMEFTPSKSHKKIIKKFNKFLNDGLMPNNKSVDSSNCDISNICELQMIKERPSLPINFDILNKLQKNENESVVDEELQPTSSLMERKLDGYNESKSATVSSCNVTSSRKLSTFKQGLGADPTKPPCKKAKLIRLERRQQKALAGGMNVERKVTNEPKTLEQFMNNISQNSKHKLKIELVLALNLKKNSEEIKLLEFELFKKYQMSVHKDPPEKCTMAGFTRFLITSPLKTSRVRGANSNVTYGTFHQQYWLDDKLIAVAVLDVLPRSVSSVYFFYDPDYAFLTLGTYGALREILYVQTLHKTVPAIEFYNMGFYIHSCVKMRYKAQFNNSFLLCPETYNWCPLEKCLPKLDMNQYCRLHDDIDAIDENSCNENDIDNIKICTYSDFMLFGSYKNKYGQQDTFDNIGRLIGKKCAATLLFVMTHQ